MTLFESILLLEKKDHLIKRLNLSDEEKSTLISFFASHPNLENKINWNRRDLSMDDFSSLMKETAESRGAIKNAVKSGDLARGLPREGFKIWYADSDFIWASPLDHTAAVELDSHKTFGRNAKWCIGTRDEPSYWENYVFKSMSAFLFLYDSKTDRKYMFELRPNGNIIVWNEDDTPAKPAKSLRDSILKVNEAFETLSPEYADKVDVREVRALFETLVMNQLDEKAARDGNSEAYKRFVIGLRPDAGWIDFIELIDRLKIDIIEYDRASITMQFLDNRDVGVKISSSPSLASSSSELMYEVSSRGYKKMLPFHVCPHKGGWHSRWREGLEDIQKYKADGVLDELVQQEGKSWVPNSWLSDEAKTLLAYYPGSAVIAAVPYASEAFTIQIGSQFIYFKGNFSYWFEKQLSLKDPPFGQKGTSMKDIVKKFMKKYPPRSRLFERILLGHL